MLEKGVLESLTPLQTWRATDITGEIQGFFQKDQRNPGEGRREIQGTERLKEQDFLLSVEGMFPGM